MSNVQHDKENSGSSRMHLGARCSFCDSGRPTGHWQHSNGVSAVYVCGRCAMQVLPRLIADAATPYQLENVLLWHDQIDKELMTGIAIAASSHIKREKDRKSRGSLLDLASSLDLEAERKLAGLDTHLQGALRQSVSNLANRGRELDK